MGAVRSAAFPPARRAKAPLRRDGGQAAAAPPGKTAPDTARMCSLRWIWDVRIVMEPHLVIDTRGLSDLGV